MNMASDVINNNLEQLFLAITPNTTSVDNANCYYNIAMCYYNNKKYYDAINYFNQAIKNFYRLDIANITVCNCYYYVAECYKNLLKYHESMDSFNKAIELYSINKNHLMVGKCMQKLGIVNSKLNKNSIAISYFLDAKSIALKLNNYQFLADVLFDIALFYITLDRVKSINYFRLAKDNYIKISNEQRVSLCNSYLFKLTS